MELSNGTVGSGCGLGWEGAEWALWGTRIFFGGFLGAFNARLASLLFKEPPSKSVRLLGALAASDAAFCACMALE